MTDRSVEDFWENAPCGHVIADPDGRIVRVNATLSRWLGYERNTLHGRLFSDLLTVGGRIHYDTHFGPLLHMSGDLNGVTVDPVTSDGTRPPMFLTANVKTDADQKPELLQITVLDAADRRAYEREPGRRASAPRRSKDESGIRRDSATRTAPTTAILRLASMPPTITTPRRSTMWVAISMTSSRCPARRGLLSGRRCREGRRGGGGDRIDQVHVARGSGLRRRSGAGAAQPQHRARPKTQRRAHSVLHTDLREADPVQQQV